MYGHLNKLRKEVASIIATSVADVILTCSLLKSESFYEANPIANWWLNQLGFSGLIVHKLLWMIVFLGVIIIINDVEIAKTVLVFAALLTGTVVSYSLLLLIFVA